MLVAIGLGLVGALAGDGDEIFRHTGLRLLVLDGLFFCLEFDFRTPHVLVGRHGHAKHVNGHCYFPTMRRIGVVVTGHKHGCRKQHRARDDKLFHNGDV